MKAIILSLLIFFPAATLSHSGGTDSNGCHAGTQPYHCHNSKSDSSVSIGAWDINAGYQYHIVQSELIPFLGASYGKIELDQNPSIGINIGLKHQDGWYAGFVSTSQSVQLGYGFFHIAANADYVGLGIRFPFDITGDKDKSLSYFSAGAFFQGSD